MTRIGPWAALALALPALVFAQSRAELNRITRVQIRGNAVEIAGTRPPDFTTFTLTDPPRLVIDVSEAVFAGAPESVPGNGAIVGVKTASYGPKPTSIARVVIGLEREVETEIEASGNVLRVHVPGAAAPVVAAGGVEGSAASGTTAQAVAKRTEEEQRLAREKALSAKQAEEERLAREKMAAAKQVEEERLSREKLAAAKQAEEERLAREKLAAARQAEEERLAREKLGAAKHAEE
ncbi:MAG TPA: AMIN domain-containing protein, partial [Myxococcaceae bacterium]|nr:AMIN domain-containing protein [Myxococcaceae bacterium]